MATVRKRNNKFVVIYDYQDEQGKRKQKWETFSEKTEAQKFKNKIELDKLTDNLLKPTVQTVESFLLEWVDIHAKAKWQYSTYSGSLSMIKNHIIPLIGSLELQKVTPRDIDKMFDVLRTKKVSVARRLNKSELPCLSSTTLRHIYILLRKAFDKAVNWKIIQHNPVICDTPKKNKANKTIWDAPTFRLALSDMDNSLLHLVVHMTFICSLRIGEACGLTWDCIDFDKKVININKTIQRVSKQALDVLSKDNLIFEFPSKIDGKKSGLILKKPKTQSSIRHIYITEQLKEELLSRKKYIEKEKAFRPEYSDFNLVFALEDGSPVEPKLCEKWFKKWQERTSYDFPEIVFQEIRHSSTTYKLGISSGDIKSVQGDTGHASAEMVVDVYSHIQDERRENLITSIGSDFYNDRNNDNTVPDNIVIGLLEAMKKNPLVQQRVLDALLADKA